LIATCHYNDGSTTLCGTVDSPGNTVTTISSSAPSVATVTSPGGLVMGIAAGSTNLRASVTPTPSMLGTSLENVSGATGFGYINEIYGVTGTSAAGYTPGDCHITIPATANWTAGDLWTCLLVLGTPGTQNASALCSNSYTMTGASWPGGDIVIPMGGVCPNLPPGQGYWVGSTTNQTAASPAQGFSNCNSQCDGSVPVNGSGTYAYRYISNTFGNYTNLQTTLTASGSPGLQVSQYILLTTVPVTSADLPLSVTAAPPSLVSAYLTAGSSTMTAGGTMQMAAKCHYTSGPDQDCTNADIYGDGVTAWRSDTPADATISASGLVTAVSSTALCSGVGPVCTPVSTPPIASMVSITAYGCVSGGADCTSGINAAISAAGSAGKAVYVPCGTFTHSAFSSTVSIYGAGSCSILYGPSATNAQITMSGTGWTLANFVSHAASSTRDSTHWNIFNNGSTNFRIDSLEVWGGNAGGIINFLQANGGIITNNYVHDTLADAIYTTYGSRGTIVANNKVRNAGDDSISNVSYSGDPAPVSGSLDQNNDVGYQSNGRGVSVVGGQNITIQGNLIASTTQNACIYLADEPSFNTLPVSNVIARNNILNTCSGSTGQPAILAYSGQGTVSDVLIQGNTVNHAVHDGMGTNSATGGVVSNVAFVGNAVVSPGSGTAISNSGSTGNTYCSGNTLNGSPVAGGSCGGTNSFTPAGSSQTWTGNLASSGVVNMTAVIHGGLTSSAYPITVNNSTVILTGVSLSLTGGVTGLFVGAMNQLKATCTYSDGSSDDCTTTDAHGNLAHTYASSAPAHATVDASSGLVTGVAPGATAFTAVAGSFTSHALPLSVFPVLSGVYTITVSGPVKFSGTVQF
jgi:hypothetical protein